MYYLSFGMCFLYTWCTREWCNRFGRNPNCRDSPINHVSQYISYALQLNNAPKPRRPGVRCTTSGLVCTSCTRGVQENGAIGLVVLQTAEILGLIIYFALHFLCVTIQKPRRPGVRCTTSALVCTSCTQGVQDNGAICLVVLQTAEILGLIIICFAIHFLCVTIE